MALAVVRDGTNPPVVVTFVRDDAPPANDGFYYVAAGQLPAGCVMQSPPVAPVPESVEAWKLREWLIHNGHSIASIDAAIAEIQDQVERELTENQWNYNTSYTRRHPMFDAFVRVTGMTAEQIDAAFREAAGYE